jgi:hypothetical protein
MQNRYIVVILSVIVVLAGVYYLGIKDTSYDLRVSGIESYEECVQAGYPIMESYPEQCATPDGRTFTRELPDYPESPEAPALPPSQTGNNGTGSGEPVFCTMDAFQCPDGSWVGRTGPNCEFVCAGQ